MKKLVLTIAIVLGMGFAASAQGLFDRGPETDYFNRDGGLLTPGLPDHNQGTNQPAPLGGGALLLIGFGAAYAMTKKKK